MFSRYRSYTTYSEENGKLVPLVEPIEVKTTTNILNPTAQPNIEKPDEEKLKSSDENKDD